MLVSQKVSPRFCSIHLKFRDGNSSENFIPRGIEESRNSKIAFLGDRGIWNLFLGVLGNFQGMSQTQNPENPLKIQKKFKKKFQPWIYISKFRMFVNNIENWLVILKNRNKNWKILTNFWKSSDIFSFFSYLSAQKGNSVFSRSSANFGEDSRSRGVIKSIPRGIEEWKKLRDLEDRGTRNFSCHPILEYEIM